MATLPALPQLAVKYTVFAHWQRELLSVVSESQLAYWRETLGDGGPASLELPTDRPRPKLQTFNGAYTPVAVDGEGVASLEGVRRPAGATRVLVAPAALHVLPPRSRPQEGVVVRSARPSPGQAGGRGVARGRAGRTWVGQRRRGAGSGDLPAGGMLQSWFSLSGGSGPVSLSVAEGLWVSLSLLLGGRAPQAADIEQTVV